MVWYVCPAPRRVRRVGLAFFSHTHPTTLAAVPSILTNPTLSLEIRVRRRRLRGVRRRVTRDVGAPRRGHGVIRGVQAPARGAGVPLLVAKPGRQPPLLSIVRALRWRPPVLAHPRLELGEGVVPRLGTRPVERRVARDVGAPRRGHGVIRGEQAPARGAGVPLLVAKPGRQPPLPRIARALRWRPPVLAHPRLELGEGVVPAHRARIRLNAA